MSTDSTSHQPSLETMIGQMLIVGFQGSYKNELQPILSEIAKHSLGGVVLYDVNVAQEPPTPHNIRSPEQVKEVTGILQDAAPIPLFIAVDQEGGIVNRLKPEYGFPPTSSWKNLGEINNPQSTLDFSESMSHTLKEVGINLNFAPVLDLSIHADSFIVQQERCFSHDPDTVAEHAETFVRGHRKNGILTACKHFPGQGSARGDTHEGFVDVTETWSNPELIPYQKLIQNDAVDCIMTSHIINRNLDPDFPATLSCKILTDLLRTEMGYQGVIISDDPQMKAISKHYNLETTLKYMIRAGVDILCFGNNLVYVPNIMEIVVKTIVELVLSGQISESRIINSYTRIQQLKQKLN